MMRAGLGSLLACGWGYGVMRVGLGVPPHLWVGLWGDEGGTGGASSLMGEVMG